MDEYNPNSFDDPEFEKEIFSLLDSLEDSLEEEIEWDLFFGLAERWFNKGRYPSSKINIKDGDRCILRIGGYETPISCVVLCIDNNEGTALVKEDSSEYEFTVPLYSLEKMEEQNEPE